jgi:RNA polymerase sigma-70 factor, ECF subfamily
MLSEAGQDADPGALVARIADGDRSALAALFSAEAGRLVAVSRRILVRRELAEEVVQETFVTVWEKAHLFNAARGSARGWLTQIARNKALNLLRDGARLDFHDNETLAEFGDRHAGADDAFAALPETNALKRCLERLEPEKRRSILLAYVAGFTHGEIAAQMRSPVGTVKAWIRRGVIALQECLS